MFNVYSSFIALIGFVFGLLFGVICCTSYVDRVYRIPMYSLGIERFQKCEINTTNCHSNWYEIVWKKEHHK